MLCKTQTRVFITFLVALLLSSACTATIRTSVYDESGMPVRDAVIFATAVRSGGVTEAVVTDTAGQGRRTSIDVVGLQFKPKLLPVQIGTAISFCNRNTVQHQIYSISSAKQFRLTLDKGTCSSALLFDKPGTVVMGSALDDRIVGYIYVVDTEWFATTGADGSAELPGLPQGTYDLRVWHPAMKRRPEALTRRVSAAAGGTGARFQLYLRSLPVPGSQPTPTLPAGPGGR